MMHAATKQQYVQATRVIYFKIVSLSAIFHTGINKLSTTSLRSSKLTQPLHPENVKDKQNISTNDILAK